MLALCASASGLAFQELYRDVAWIRATWFGNDLITLLVAVPALVWSLVAVRRGSRLGALVWLALLDYTAYGYAYYLFGTRMNAFFPFYPLLFTGSLIAIGLVLCRIDADSLAETMPGVVSTRGVALYLGFSGVGLGMAWLAQWALLVFGGTVPVIGERPFALVAALDLALIVPFLLLSAVLLWRRSSWGYVLAAMMVVKSATYTLVLTVNSVVATARGIEGFAKEIPVWGTWTAVGLVAMLVLLMRAARSGLLTSRHADDEH